MVAPAVQFGVAAESSGPGTFSATFTDETECGGSAELMPKEVGVNSTTLNDIRVKAVVSMFADLHGEPEHVSQAIASVRVALEESIRKASPPVPNDAFGLEEAPPAGGEEMPPSSAPTAGSGPAAAESSSGANDDPARVPVFGGAVPVSCGFTDGRNQRLATAHFRPDGSPPDAVGDGLVHDRGNTDRSQFRTKFAAAAAEALTAAADPADGGGAISQDFQGQLGRALRTAADRADADRRSPPRSRSWRPRTTTD